MPTVNIVVLKIVIVSDLYLRICDKEVSARVANP